MKIVIPMPPKAKGRPRFANGHAYTPAETREYEEAVKLIAKTQIKKPFTGPLKIKIQFFLPIPKSWSDTKKRAAINRLVVPANKPDIDNLCKAIMDALNGGIGYDDDKQVVQLHIYKWYGTPRTEIELEEL